MGDPCTERHGRAEWPARRETGSPLTRRGPSQRRKGRACASSAFCEERRCCLISAPGGDELSTLPMTPLTARAFGDGDGALTQADRPAIRREALHRGLPVRLEEPAVLVIRTGAVVTRRPCEAWREERVKRDRGADVSTTRSLPRSTYASTKPRRGRRYPLRTRTRRGGFVIAFVHSQMACCSASRTCR